MTALDPEVVALLTATNHAHIATLMPDGSPQVTPVWVDSREGLIMVNSAEGRVKVRNMRRDPRVAVSVIDPAHPWPPLAVWGTVVELTHAGADEHIDALSRRYEGRPWEPVAGQVRVIAKIRPDRVWHPR